MAGRGGTTPIRNGLNTPLAAPAKIVNSHSSLLIMLKCFIHSFGENFLEFWLFEDLSGFFSNIDTSDKLWNPFAMMLCFYL